MDHTLKYSSHIKSWQPGISDKILVGLIGLQQLLCRFIGSSTPRPCSHEQFQEVLTFKTD
jgi:hypothetical protein